MVPLILGNPQMQLNPRRIHDSQLLLAQDIHEPESATLTNAMGHAG